MSLATDIGDNAIFDFMINQYVKGSGNAVYGIESDGYGLFKRLISDQEYKDSGDRYIPISDAVLNSIPE
ncbi:MAG: hypothetical protein WCV41_02415 [Patescibacteria group bacterium]